MSKIFNVRLPNASPQYSATQFNQLVRSLEQVILQLNNSYTSTINDDTSSALTYFEAGGQGGPLDGTEIFYLPYASFIDRTTQTAALIDTAYALPLEIQQLSNGVYRDSINTSRVYVDVPGVYNIQFSAQLQKSSGGAATAWIWPRINGQNVGASATKVTVQGSSAAAVAAWNFLLDLDAGDYFELAWAVSNTGLVLLAEAATAFCPSIPSLILTVVYVSSISEIGPSVRYMPAGVQGTGRVGQVIAPGYLVSGLQATGSIGQVSAIPSIAPQATGVGGTGSLGTAAATGNAAVAANGVDGAGDVGDASATGDSSSSQSGIAGSGGVGSVTVTVT